MISFTTHRFLLFSRKEFWFYDGETIETGSYNMFSAAKKVCSAPVQHLQKYPTSVIDLTKTRDELFNAIHERMRRYLKSTEKKAPEILHILEPSLDDRSIAIASFNSFARDKKIQPLKKKWLNAALDSKNICFSKIKMGGKIISTHIYIFDKERCIFTHTFNDTTVGDERSRSDANQYLLWQDILFFKEKGLHYFDLGGVNVEKLPGISNFKSKFGGTTEEYYRYIKTSAFIFFFAKIYKSIF